MENQTENIEASEQSDNKKWKNRNRILPSILISLLIPLILCFAIPFEIYANNMQEFLFGLWDFLPLCIVLGVIGTAVFLSVLLFVPERVYKILSFLILVFALLLFVQGTYLNAGLNSLEGDTISGTPSWATKIINIFIWIALLGGAVGVTFINDKKGIIKIVSLVLAVIIIAVHLMIPVFAVINNNGVFMSKEDKLNSDGGANAVRFVSTKNLTTVSSNRNVFYFCIDRFDEHYAEDVYEHNPELFDILEGFTSFQDHIALYGHTFPGVAHMLTNYRYDISLFRAQNLNKAYEENTTLKTLHEKGYKINIYGERFYDYNNANGLPDYVENISSVYKTKVNKPFLLSSHMVCLALYRCFPLLIKPIFASISSDTCNSFVSIRDTDGYEDYTSGNKKVLKLVKETPFNTVEENVFSFLHFTGCHNVNFDYKDGKAQPSKSDLKGITDSVRDCFEIINQYITALKEIGAYKDATIIITGDHSAPGKDRDEITSAKLTAMYFKPAGEDEGLKFSSAKACQDNIWATIMQSEKIETQEDYGLSLFSPELEKDVEREYIWQTYKHFSLDEYYYKITGSGRTFDNWELTKTVHADKYLMD